MAVFQIYMNVSDRFFLVIECEVDMNFKSWISAHQEKFSGIVNISYPFSQRIEKVIHDRLFIFFDDNF
jgi:hypothetical protein